MKATSAASKDDVVMTGDVRSAARQQSLQAAHGTGDAPARRVLEITQALLQNSYGRFPLLQLHIEPVNGFPFIGSSRRIDGRIPCHASLRHSVMASSSDARQFARAASSKLVSNDDNSDNRSLASSGRSFEPAERGNLGSVEFSIKPILAETYRF